MLEIPDNHDKELNSLLSNDLLKVVIAGCIAIVIALLFMSITSMMITKNAVVNKLKNSDLNNLAASIGAVIEGRIEKAIDASLIMADDPTVIKWVQSGDKDLESEKIVQEKMRNLVENFGYDTSFLVSDVTHNYWSYHGKTFELLDVVSKEDPSDVWFFNTMNMNKRYAINIDPNKELNDTFVWINTLVGDDKQPLAVTGLGMNLSAVIEELIEEKSINQVQNDIWLVDRQGIIYLSKNPKYLNKNLTDYIPASLAGTINQENNQENEFRVAEYQDKHGEVYDIAYKSIKGTDWKLLVQIPRSESLTFIKAIAINTVLACLIIILIMVAIFYWLSKRIANPYKRALLMNEELDRKVKERTLELQEKNTKIQDSIEYAKMIQQTILPSEAEMKNIMKDYFVISEPRDTVGGDFYWIRGIDKDFVLIVGDCTGHGVPGALMTTAVNAMLNHIVDELKIYHPAAILNELDRLIKQSFRPDNQGEEVQYGLDAGILYVRPHHLILFSGAGISLFVAHDNGIHEIKGNRSTIDCTDRYRDDRFEDYTLSYQQGTALFMATDGISDQPGGEKHLPYGKKRLITSIESVLHLEMKQQADIIQQSFREYATDESLRDDITLLGFRL